MAASEINQICQKSPSGHVTLSARPPPPRVLPTQPKDAGMGGGGQVMCQKLPHVGHGVWSWPSGPWLSETAYEECLGADSA